MKTMNCHYSPLFSLVIASSLQLLDSAAITTAMCGKPAISPGLVKIVGGVEAMAHSWPWQAALYMTLSFGTAQCGGSLINNQWILTAAHCVTDEADGTMEPHRILIRLGAHNTDYFEAGQVSRFASKVFRHRSYRPQRTNYDIALIKLAAPVSFSASISPVCLTSSAEGLPRPSETGFVMGWGRKQENGQASSVLRQTSVPVTDHGACKSAYAAVNELVSDDQFCAGLSQGGKDSCNGDSGGPFVVKQPTGQWVQKGIVSWGLGCAQANYPGVYTSVSHYRTWIDQIISANQGAVNSTKSKPHLFIEKKEPNYAMP